MHSQAMEVINNSVPAFLAKLWRLVEDPSCNDLIEWSENGTSFFIRDQARISRELLPLYFKHNNVASFIRQLNMYGFRKVMHVDKGGLRVESDEIEFTHPFFVKENEDLLPLIKRKIPVVKPSTTSEDVKVTHPDLVNKVLLEVKNLHGKQESMDNKLADMKRENEALWREVASMRQKHMKQQQIVNQLVQFLIRLVNPNRGLIPKRKLALMINDSRGPDSKVTRTKRNYAFEGNNGSTNKHLASPGGTMFPSSPASGPLIHDITDAVDPDSFIEFPTISIKEDVLSPGESSPKPDFVEAAVAAIYSPSYTIESMEEQEEAEEAANKKNLDDHQTDVASSSALAQASGESKDPPSDDSTAPGAIHLNYLIQEMNKGVTDSEPASGAVAASDNAVALGDSSMNRIDLKDHVDNVSVNLESLKDMLTSSGCSIDASTLFGLFSGDDLMSNKNISDLGDYSVTPERSGTELMQYNFGGGMSDLLDVPVFDTDLSANDDSVIDDRMFDSVDAIDYMDENLALETPDTSGLSLEAVLANLADAGPSNNDQPDQTPATPPTGKGTKGGKAKRPQKVGKR